MADIETGILVDLSTPPCQPGSTFSIHKEENVAVTDIETGILVDLSTPPCQPGSTFSIYKEENAAVPDPDNCEQGDQETKNISITDSVELERGDDTERRHSFAQKTHLLHNHILKDSPVKLIEDEQFDFDFVLSPASCDGNESAGEGPKEPDDEVFIGPVGFRERCVAATVKEVKPLSPLTAAQLAEVVKEATLVAVRIEAASSTTPQPGGDCTSPVVKKRHSRKGTFTLDDSPFELLPASVRKSLPIIDFDDVNDELSGKKAKSDKERNKINNKCEVEDKENVSPAKQKRRSMNVPKVCSTKAFKRLSMNTSKTEKPDNAPTKLPAAKSALPRSGSFKISQKTSGTDSQKTKISKLQAPSMKTSSNLNQFANTASKPIIRKSLKPPSKFSGNTSLSQKSETILKPSKRLSLNETASANSNKVTNGSENTSISETKSNTAANKKMPSYKAPLLKPSLMKPGCFQKKTFAVNNTTAGQKDTAAKAGPMKTTATVPQPKVDSTTVERKPTLRTIGGSSNGASKSMTTPVKQQKNVQPKQLLSNFASPSRSSSVSTPASSNKRRSFLPTPQTSSSTGSFPSPMTRRSSSTSSAVSDSPFCKTQRSAHRLSSVGRYSSLDEINEHSPSVLKPRKARVLNTPNMPKQKLSAWSPVKKLQPWCLEDAVSMCTKRTSSK